MKQEETQQETQQQTTFDEKLGLVTSDGVEWVQTLSQRLGARQRHRCGNCDIEFFWSPTVAQGQIYCCTGCAAGGPCNCDYSLYRSVTILGVIHYE